MADSQRREREENEPEAKGVDLVGVAVMEHVEDAQGKRFAARWDNHDKSFGVPKAKEISDIPSEENGAGEQWKLHFPKGAGGICAVRARGGEQVRVDAAAGLDKSLQRQ